MIPRRIVAFTYLQHSDPTIPYYRDVRMDIPGGSLLLDRPIFQAQWNFARGALATVDRPFFGWVDRFFLHNVN
jgi:hypothetical protein